jgi:hypothetical protein
MRLSDDQRLALDQWRAFRNLETSGDLSLAPRPSRPLLRRGLPPQSVRAIATVGAAYIALLVLIAVVSTRRISRVATAALALGTVVAIGATAAYSVGRIGSGRTIQVHHNSVLHQIPGSRGAVLSTSGIVEFPAHDEYGLRLRTADGVIEPPSATDHTEAIVDSDGLSSIAGVYGLGSRRSFTAEAVLDSQPVAVSANGGRVTVANRSSSTLEDCRFADGFSTSRVGLLAPGASVTADRRGEVLGPMFTCTALNPPLELTSRNRPIQMQGATLIAVYDRARSGRAAEPND